MDRFSRKLVTFIACNLAKFSRDERRIERFFQCNNKKPIPERIL